MRRESRPGVWVLRVLVFAGLVVAILAGRPEGYDPPTFVVVLVVLGALASAFRPEHLSLSITMGLVLVWWALQVRSEMPTAALVVAAGLMLSHVSATLLSYGPPSLAIDPELALLWTARGLLAWVAAFVVWVVARTYAGHDVPAVFWLAGLAAAVVAAVVAGVTVPVRGESPGR
jgi:hypothetical protein